jgi:hypothetical protein
MKSISVSTRILFSAPCGFVLTRGQVTKAFFLYTNKAIQQNE